MAKVSQKLRNGVYARDGYKCAASGAVNGLSIQHRQAVGMGGSKKVYQPGELLTVTAVMNSRFEADLQTQALCFGWKVPRHFMPDRLRDIPVFYVGEGWFLLTFDFQRIPVMEGAAHELMRDMYGPVWDVWASEIGLIERGES